MALAMVATLGGTARSQPSPAKMTEAQALFDEGIRLFNVGRFEEACPKFEASLALVAGIGTRGKLAECYEKLGKTASAWRLYREVVRLSQRTDDKLRERVAAERARALEPRLGRLIIRPGPSVTTPGFQVRSNDQVVEPRMFDIEKVVDPGTYIIVASAPAHAQWATTVQVGEGKRKVVEVSALQTMDDAGGGSLFGPEGMRIAAYTLLGVGAVSVLGGGSYFGLKARSKRNEAYLDNVHCNEATDECDDIGLGLIAEARTNANYANISVGVGLAAAVGGAVLWWRSTRAPAGNDQPAASISPSLGPRGVGLVWSRRF